ncbi:LysE family transporter [Glaesserella sp.]|uniref:LysE family transporter n=1 Tax=Glaesserella sp. TaxID=2094731 RepID=UPI0035A06E6F
MWTIFFVQLVGLVSPGPDFFYVTRKAMGDTRRNAILGTIGITIGVGFWALIVLFGLAFLNRTIPSFQYILMLFGGSYLAYNGIKMVQIRQSATLDERNVSQTKTPAHKEILKGLMINLSNPKVVIFFGSVLSGYVSNLSNIKDSLLVLLIVTGSTLIYFSLVSLLFSHRHIRAFYAKHNRYLDNFAGAVFIFFGATLIYEGITTLM